MLPTHIATSATVVAILAATGCGGSRTNTSVGTIQKAQSSTQQISTSHALSRAELVAKANAICARLRAQGTATVIRSRQDYATKLPLVAGHYRAAAVELGQLVPPESMTSDWKRLVSAHRTIAADTSKLVPYVEVGNQVLARRLLSDAQATQKQIVAIATRNGYTECGRRIS